jgi:hypothetical protein
MNILYPSLALGQQIKKPAYSGLDFNDESAKKRSVALGLSYDQGSDILFAYRVEYS